MFDDFHLAPQRGIPKIFTFYWITKEPFQRGVSFYLLKIGLRLFILTIKIFFIIIFLG